MSPDRDFGDQTLRAISTGIQRKRRLHSMGWAVLAAPSKVAQLPGAGAALCHPPAHPPPALWQLDEPMLGFARHVRASPSPAASRSTRGWGSSIPADFTFSICTTQAPAGCASHKGALIISQTQPLTRLSSQAASFADTQLSPPPPPPPTSSSQPVPSSQHVRLKLLRLSHPTQAHTARGAASTPSLLCPWLP